MTAAKAVQSRFIVDVSAPVVVFQFGVERRLDAHTLPDVVTAVSAAVPAHPSTAGRDFSCHGRAARRRVLACPGRLADRRLSSALDRHIGGASSSGGGRFHGGTTGHGRQSVRRRCGAGGNSSCAPTSASWASHACRTSIEAVGRPRRFKAMAVCRLPAGHPALVLHGDGCLACVDERVVGHAVGDTTVPEVLKALRGAQELDDFDGRIGKPRCGRDGSAGSSRTTVWLCGAQEKFPPVDVLRDITIRIGQRVDVNKPATLEHSRRRVGFGQGVRDDGLDTIVAGAIDHPSCRRGGDPPALPDGATA